MIRSRATTCQARPREVAVLSYTRRGNLEVSVNRLLSWRRLASAMQGTIVASALSLGGAPSFAACCFTEFPIPTGGSSPQGITAGPDGALWFTGDDRRLIRITTSEAPPQTDKLYR
jgi:hypothetical protein